MLALDARNEANEPAASRRLTGGATGLGAPATAIFPGVLASGTITLAATWLAQHYNAPMMLFALLLGMAFHFLHKEGRCIAGIEFSSKSPLRIGVGLLGARTDSLAAPAARPRDQAPSQRTRLATIPSQW